MGTAEIAACAAAESLPAAFQGMGFPLLTWIFMAASRSLPAPGSFCFGGILVYSSAAALVLLYSLQKNLGIRAAAAAGCCKALCP